MVKCIKGTPGLNSFGFMNIIIKCKPNMRKITQKNAKILKYIPLLINDMLLILNSTLEFYWGYF